MKLKNYFFINKNLYEDLDLCYKKSIESKQHLELIQKYFCDILSNYEKSTNKNNTYVKVHETAKSDPVLITTKRRAKIIEKELELKIKDSGGIVDIEYQSEYSDTKEIYKLDIKNINFIDNTTNSNIIISSKDLKNICASISNSKNELINKLEIYYNKFIIEFISYDLTELINFIITIDILYCKCSIANDYNYCKPTIKNSNKSFVNFTGIRHCLIEHLNNKELYITNDLSIGEENNDCNGILLYGTNAVGKTSIIKAIGIAIIMAQAGLYVPATNFDFFPYNSIFTRILGNDNIFKGLSTFAVEMSELRCILQLADKNSIILGDELCSGTESDSALSIFVSGLEILHEKDCTFLFATHFHEIVKYDEIIKLDKLKLYHMTIVYDNIKKKLIYDRKLKEGSGDSMYGLEVCKSLNLPDSFLDRAHELRIKYNNFYKNILSRDTSKYNSNKIKNICEICKIKDGSEIHHLEYQKNADNKYIKNKDYNFNKDHVANLINICNECHDNIHRLNIKLKKYKTSDNYELF